MLLKFKKKFPKYLSTYMLHLKVGKERGQVQTKQIFFIIQHISYVQKKESGSILYKLEILIKLGGDIST